MTPTPSPTPTPAPCPAISIESRFNDAPIAGGNCIWFNSALEPIGLDPGAGPTTITMQGQTVQFAANGQPVTVTVPRAVITFDPGVTTATTTFDAVGQQWVTEVPSNIERDVFASGVMFPVSGGLPGGIEPVTWSATFSSDSSSVRLLWRWEAAVYTECDTGLAALGVKPIDGFTRNPYPNFDPAGTPEAIKRSVTFGARGGGRPDYTGFPSRLRFVNPCD